MTRGGTGGSATRLLAAASLFVSGFALLSTGCANPEDAVTMTVERYLSAVTQRDDEAMASLWAPFRRQIASMTPDEKKQALAAFSARFRQAHKLYDEAKLEGALGPDDLGVTLFRALGMGKGAVSFPISARIEDGGAAARVRTRVVTNLETLHLDSLPDGVRIYLMGYPVGKLEMITVGFDELSNHRLLESVDIDWRLSKTAATADEPGRWLIESIAADPSSSVEWKPKAAKG
jgi:hypothetical protein